MTRRALVLGGGGVAGIAWQTGVLLGLAEAGADVSDAEMLLGTSAGSSVAAQISSGAALTELFERQADEAKQDHEPHADSTIDELVSMLARAAQNSDGSAIDTRRRIGTEALAASTISERERRAIIERRLPSHSWPNRDLRIVTVDAVSGRHRVLDRGSGVQLVDAVAASCAIPGMWPPVTIGDHRYVDGGIRASENADLAVGFEKVLVFRVGALDLEHDPFDIERERLVKGGSKVEVIAPDADSAAAIGPDATDIAVRSAAAVAGRAQGNAIAERIAEFWV
ncbi:MULTISPECIES: patatin-like phospholipase family protein [unclassified Rhodococcus (in: high G+C Gram-positive bacteria)]|uniref:patatin-like phospholipase family protein n=1 Tax=unclassified Rhodococcus (in: high G+C Gram-positive bacteria) TaxID=192944 RepID=UPI0007BBEF04|nr:MULTISPECIES: patatin-like phospholipase family protein [unclassified Rhodococcus (in: high G+C Gram-positive bacteria)]KZF07790.1 patatin [Rhodococcus sp. EPR-147]KZF08404.1 patatin [Rhodococcus sp. EPR-279]